MKSGINKLSILLSLGVLLAPALRAAMDKLWNDLKLAEQFGKNAGIRFEKMFTSRQMVEKYVEIYKSLLTHSSPIVLSSH